MVTEWKKSWKSAKRLKLPRFWGPSTGETIIFTGSTYMPKDSPTLKLVVYQVSSKSLEPFLDESKLPYFGQNSHTEPSGTYTGAHARCFPKRNFFFKSFLFTSFKKRLKKQISQTINNFLLVFVLVFICRYLSIMRGFVSLIVQSCGMNFLNCTVATQCIEYVNTWMDSHISRMENLFE